MLLRHPEFEQALFERPDDDGAWAVYGDWLAAHGDPRGEIIQLELAIAAGAITPELRSRYAKLMIEEHPRWVGESLAALLAEPDASRNLVVEWRRGHLLNARIHGTGPQPAVQRLDALLESPTVMMLEELELSVDADREDLDHFAGVVWQRASLPALRRLEIAAWTFRRGPGPPLIDLAFDWEGTWPRLENLDLHGLHWRLSPPRHARLRQLTFSCRQGIELDPLRMLAQAELPRLEQLALFFGRLEPGLEPEFASVLDDVLASVSRTQVQRLALVALDQPETLLAKLRRHRDLLDRLERLYLGWGLLGDELVPGLVELLAGCPRLREVDLGGNYISEVGGDSLRRTLAGRLQIDGLDRQKNDRSRDDRQVPVFGRYGIPESHYQHWAEED